MKLAALGDPHYGSYRNAPEIDGVNGRLLDIKARMQEILDYIKEHGIQHLVVVGDLFRNRIPHPVDMAALSEFIRACIDLDVRTWILTGNHDRARLKSSDHTLAPFIPLVRGTCVSIVDEPRVVEGIIPGGRLFLFPYVGSPQEAHLREFLWNNKPAAGDILAMHGTIKGAVPHPVADYEISDGDVIDPEMLKPFRAVLAGDIHVPQEIGNAWYTGSVERLDFGDEMSAKSFIVADIDEMDVHVERVPLHARRMLTLTGSQVALVVAGQVSVKDAIIRVIGADRDRIEEIRRILVERGCYHIDAIYTLERELQEAPKQGIDVSDFVKQFATRTGYEGDVDSAISTIAELLNAQL